MENIIKDGQSANLGIAIQSLIQDNLRRINTCFIARVESVKGNKVNVVDALGESAVINNVLVAQPFLNAGLFYPVQAGDYGFCIVCKNDISNFKKSGGSAKKNSERLFDLADSIFLPMSLYNQQNFDGGVGSGSGIYFTKDDLITLKNRQTTLKKILEQLVDTIAGLITTNAVQGSPCSLNPVSIQKLNLFKQQLGLFFKE